jgi:DNA-binding MarR family transcriptional regulator
VKIKIDKIDVHELRTLRLLDAIDSKKSPSQRDLASAVGVSLGLVNSFVRRLAKKGYFKITHLPRNRIRYILTPKGAAEKSRLTYAYLQFSYQFYRDARSKLRVMLQDLVNQKMGSVAFFGAGDLAEIAYLSLQETDLEFAGIGDPNGNYERFFGHPVLDLDSFGNLSFDAVIVTHDRIDADILEPLRQIGIHDDRIKTL